MSLIVLRLPMAAGRPLHLFRILKHIVQQVLHRSRVMDMALVLNPQQKIGRVFILHHRQFLQQIPVLLDQLSVSVHSIWHGQFCGIHLS